MTIWAVIAGCVVFCGLMALVIGVGCADPPGHRSSGPAAARQRRRRLRRLLSRPPERPGVLSGDQTRSSEGGSAQNGRSFRPARLVAWSISRPGDAAATEDRDGSDESGDG